MLNSSLRNQLTSEIDSLSTRQYLHLMWHDILGACDSGQELSTPESQAPDQKTRQSLPLHCAAMYEEFTECRNLTKGKGSLPNLG